MAFPAGALACSSGFDEKHRTEEMSFGTVCLGAITLADNTALDVFSVGHNFKMFGVYTSAVAAEVVQGHTRRNCAEAVFEDPSIRFDSTTLNAQSGVACLRKMGCPYPTTTLLVDSDLRGKAVNHRHSAHMDMGVWERVDVTRYSEV